MEHWNDNIVCCVDVETTGPTPRFHDIVDVCILPLGSNLKPSRKVLPFTMSLIPMRKENIDQEALRIQRRHMDYSSKDKICWKQEKLIDHILKGCEPARAADLFVEWWEKLNLLPFKKIMPVAHNWVFDRAFLEDWLGWETFDMCFSPLYRDTMVLSLFENDISGYHDLRYPFPKNNLAYLCSQLKIKRLRSHTALDDCVATAEVFRLMIRDSMRFGLSNREVIDVPEEKEDNENKS